MPLRSFRPLLLPLRAVVVVGVAILALLRLGRSLWEMRLSMGPMLKNLRTSTPVSSLPTPAWVF